MCTIQFELGNKNKLNAYLTVFNSIQIQVLIDDQQITQNHK